LGLTDVRLIEGVTLVCYPFVNFKIHS